MSKPYAPISAHQEQNLHRFVLKHGMRNVLRALFSVTYTQVQYWRSEKNAEQVNYWERTSAKVAECSTQFSNEEED